MWLMTTVARRHISNAKLPMASMIIRRSACRGDFTSIVCCEVCTIYTLIGQHKTRPTLQSTSSSSIIQIMVQSRLQCWSNVCEAGPALKWLKMNASCWLRVMFCVVSAWCSLESNCPLLESNWHSPMLTQCWPSVADDGTTLNQHRLDVLFSLPGWLIIDMVQSTPDSLICSEDLNILALIIDIECYVAVRTVMVSTFLLVNNVLLTDIIMVQRTPDSLICSKLNQAF